MPIRIAHRSKLKPGWHAVQQAGAIVPVLQTLVLDIDVHHHGTIRAIAADGFMAASMRAKDWLPAQLHRTNIRLKDGTVVRWLIVDWRVP